MADAEVLRLYKNRIIPIAYVEGSNRVTNHDARAKMVQLADLFSVPEMGLLCNVAEYFVRNHFDYHPEIMFRDIKVLYTDFDYNLLNFSGISFLFGLSHNVYFSVEFRKCLSSDNA